MTAWSASPTLRFIGEGEAHLVRLADLARAADLRGPRVHDARIAAIRMHHGIEHLVTLDRDFTRFPRLATRSPLTGSGN
ncbi:MAG: type II toxin-antitoxin system VapC family toxin [Euzebya sp.]